ncbi:MAG: 23S rRNA (adenine(2503)-C(2))-methyltransferase RlmN, partial [Acetobacter syzygii]
MSSSVSSASVPADAAAVTALNADERARILAKAALFSPPSPVTADGRRDIVGLSREELTEILVEIGEKPFRTKQWWHWIYHQGVTDFSL